MAPCGREQKALVPKHCTGRDPFDKVLHGSLHFFILVSYVWFIRFGLYEKASAFFYQKASVFVNLKKESRFIEKK